MEKNTRRKLALICLALLLCLGIACLYVRQKIEQPRDAGNTHAVSFTIESGQGMTEIGTQLDQAGLINGKDFFVLYLLESGARSKLRAGSYQISPSMSIPQMVSAFTYGEYGIKSNETRVSLAEGLSDQEVLAALKSSGAVESDANFEQVRIDTSRYSFLSGSDANDLQGYLFPDTYNFFKGSSLEDVTKKMLDNFGQKLTPEMRAEIARQGKSVHDVVTLASIIEKEAASPEDMPTIASVFYNRLAVGQMLQSDATVNYATHSGRAIASQADLAVDSPYNTYKYAGLPPTPICNPGIEAIKAAIYPAQTDYFYFLTTQDGEKKTYFSKTYEEHLENKALYLNK